MTVQTLRQCFGSLVEESLFKELKSYIQDPESVGVDS